MIDRINDIMWQAHQGSVAAIIQLLNEKLASSGVRTRAIFDDGVLQVLCEAHTVDKLEQSTLVKKIQQTLEFIAPRNILRVTINSRIVREQQLLWLEEINHDPNNQLLWSQEIILAKPNIVRQIITEFKERKIEKRKTHLLKSQSSRLSVISLHNYRTKKTLLEKALGVRTLYVFFVLISVALYAFLGNNLRNPIKLGIFNLSSKKTNHSQTRTLPTVSRPPSASLSSVDVQKRSFHKVDLFAAAVRIANQASATGKTATTLTQWLDIAARWQRASELMGSVPPNHSRYHEAQIRTKLYKKYSEAAEKESQKRSS